MYTEYAGKSTREVNAGSQGLHSEAEIKERPDLKWREKCPQDKIPPS